MLIATALAVALQFSADFQPGEPGELVELLSVILGSGGALLFGLAYLLQHVSQRVAAASVSCENGPIDHRQSNSRSRNGSGGSAAW